MAEREPPSSTEPHDEPDGGKKRSKPKKLKQDPRLITDGLVLSQKGSKQAYATFTYALTALMESGTKIETKVLTTDPVESQHIRLHSLKPGDTLATIAAAYRKSYTAAVVLVNTEDNLELPAEVTEGVTKSKKTVFPIAVVSASDGVSLKGFVNRHETGDLSARLENKNQPHVEYRPQPKPGSSPGSESTITLNTRRRGFSFRRKGRRYADINLKDEVKALVFPVNGPVCVSEDEERFKIVMTSFYQYEQMIQRGGHVSAGPLFTKLMKHIDEMFARDFPFYLLVAYRAQKKSNQYLCDELRPYVKTCVEKFERLEPVSIAKTLETFFSKVEDFNLMFESDNSTASIYQLLEEACAHLVVFSQKNQDTPITLPKSVYYRMLWISTAYKCRIQRTTDPRDRVDYWRQHLTNAENFSQLSTDVIQSLKRGVEFGRLLQLANEVSFSSYYMGDILTSKGVVRPFNQLKEFVIVLEPYIQPEEDLVTHILSRPSEVYKQAKPEGWRRAQGDKPLLAIFQDGLGFLDTVLEFSRKRQWSSGSLHTQLKSWLSILMEPVDLLGDRAEPLVKELLSHKATGVTKQYYETIKRELVIKLEGSLDKLSVEQFLKLYKAFLIWPPWIVQKFLKQYTIPKTVSICSETWKQFFAVFVERFQDAEHHKFVLEFLKSVAQCYLEQARAKEFILDLLRLDVPSLFRAPADSGSLSSQQSSDEPTNILAMTVPEEFSQFLSDFIQRNSLRDDLMDDIEKIWKLIAEDSEFQQLVLQVLQQELIPESGSLHGPLRKPMKFLLTQCVNTICTGLDSLHDLSSRLTFCWGVVASCCQKMPLTENLDWIQVYYSVIDQLGRIYSVYQSNQKENGDKQSVVTESSMSSDVTECSAEGVTVFFRWIAGAQQTLSSWRDKLKQCDLNYDELLLYTKQMANIGRAAMALSSDSLVVDSHYVKALKVEYEQQFELLNIFLVRYIPGVPDSPWYSLLHILSNYGVNLPSNILLSIKRFVSFPGERAPMGRRDSSLENPIPCSVSGNFRPPGEVQVEISRDMTAAALKKLVAAIASFLQPITDLNFLSFFSLNESEIFDKHLKLQLRKLESEQTPTQAPPPSLSLMSISLVVEPVFSGVNVHQLAKALDTTKDFVSRLIVGNASYVEIVAEGSLSLRQLDIDQEFNILGDYAQQAGIEAGNSKGLNGVKALLQLFQYTRHIQVIHSVCQQYKLANCLQDPNLKELVELVETLEENRENLTAKDAIDKMKKVTTVLCLETGQSLRFLDLFSAVQDSADFHRFVVQEKQFVGNQGQELFLQQFQLITTQLQHEEYNEAVLNHLFAAFRLITPFTNTEQDFTSLMISVASLNAMDARRQLETVNRNINLIRLWFSRAEGDTLQGVASELQCVLKTGYYSFTFSSAHTLTHESGSVQLHYIPHSSLYQNIGEVTDTPSLPTEDCWNEEAISDFVRKLGFLDAEGTSEMEINHFLNINQTATKLLGLYSKLRELGHPKFLATVLRTDIRCSLQLDEATELVSQAAQLLLTWEKEVANLRTEYEQLLYFSIPKLLHLYHNLTADSPSLNAVVQDVGFLFENKPQVQEQLRESVKALLEAKPHTQVSSLKRTPMHIVGSFLSTLFSDLALSSNSLKRRRRGSVGSLVSRSSTTPQSTHILHSCAGFSQSQLLRLIISIYGGVPESFEVYHCRASSTEEELRLFMNPKRATKRPFQYLILEVNKLPYRLQEALIRIHFDLKQAMSGSEEMDSPCVHFVETGQSLLQEMPWLLRMDYKGSEPPLDFAEASSTSKNAALHGSDFGGLQLVYGHAGDGKTHYIENQMKLSSECLRVAVNEAFTPLSTIQKLCSMELDKPEAAVFFNFTLLPPGDAVSADERNHYLHLIESINWFFFDLFILGYVEDPVTGQSFRFPGGLRIAIYAEVPSRVDLQPAESLRAFYEDIPSLGLLGTSFFVDPGTPFVVDDDVQLVCKYLKAYKSGAIDRLYRDVGGIIRARRPGAPVKFSQDPDLTEAECRKLLDKNYPQHMKVNKATQKLFIKYMKRRCAFLDNCPAFNFNPGSTEYMTGAKGEKKKNDTTQLGSTLMATMLSEVSDFCDPMIREDWALKPHHQLIYDFKDGGGSIGLMSLHPDLISKEDVEKFKKIGVQMPSMFELYTRECLDSFLSRALDVPLNKDKRLSIIDECQYVLTLDFALKMLNIHERAEGGVPVIIEGETGVGKTALVEMLSRLWNYSLFNTWNTYKERIMDFMKGKLQELPASSFKKHAGSMESVLAITNTSSIVEDDLMQIAEIPLPGSDEKQFYSVIRDHLMELAGDPLLSVLELRPEEDDGVLTVPLMVASAQFKDNPKDTSRLLYKFLNCRVKTLFFKLNVHAAMQPSTIMEFFQPIFEQARSLQRAYQRFTSTTKVPFISVFLDEVNTSSCLGLFKEVIVDRTLDGEPIPSNVFIVGACNPHRGNSLAAHGGQETWVRGTYYVRQLHPTIRCLMWDYGALGEQQERDYILAKMRLSNRDTANADLANLTELIVLSQKLMRRYAMDQLKDCGLTEAKASEYSRSCVSQRDIQRVFTFYEWLYRMYMKYKPCGEQCNYNSRAVAVALGLVYFLRLNNDYRKKYRNVLDHEMAPSQLSFTKTFREELNWYINHIDLPKGIAKTQALKENLFATIVCTMTHTPLVIVGSPGSSKTLSFNLTLANLKGQESKVPQFRETDIFKSLDPQIYQCSRRTTSNEIMTVFSRAINRQRSHQSIPLPVYCVVFMDEAGLPEERHESLKVLHYYLDKQEVSFVAISNHVLDAAKTNRALSLFRPEATKEELTTLAKGCLCTTPDKPPPELKNDMAIVANFCSPYLTLMSKPRFARFFGLRDFINFISYLRRKRTEMLHPQLVMEALERNFNGVNKEDFDYICKIFLRAVHSAPEKVGSKNILDILCFSFLDHPEDAGAENEMRYKLIIDSSDDGSLVRLLFSTGVLKRHNTRVYVCSDFPGDAELQKVNTIAAIRHSVTEGHTVVLSQTDSIHESFYDLFNRRFHRIDATSGPRYYANIAIGAHIKPCRVHKNFDCVVVVKQSEVESIPPPFLNRFEKYYLSHELVLEATLGNIPPAIAAVLKAALEKAGEFVKYICGSTSLYGLQQETLSSLLMSLLPPLEHEYLDSYPEPAGKTMEVDVQASLMSKLLTALKENAGFQIPLYSEEEAQADTDQVMEIIMLDSEFSGQILRLMSSESKKEATVVIHNAVVEALNVLHYATSIEDFNKEVSANACMVVSMLTHWLVRYLSKRVMQLMTSEALCMHHRKIPSSYIQAYLNEQHHFSLKELLESQYNKLENENSSAANKLVCFMRSSSPLHHLPAQYPTPDHHPSHSADNRSLLSELVFSNTKELVVHKMSSITSFGNVNELLKNFTLSLSQKVMLIIVNMEDTSKELVNHLRIMIEEAESRYLAPHQKLFAVLLHFQTCRPSSPCYPVMFLPGWDFNYLEMIGYSPRGGVLDIRDWFRQCYGTSSMPDHSIAPHLSALLHEAITIISSRVSFRQHPGSLFNTIMRIPDRNRALETLFFKKGVGEVLCQRFNSYWNPSVMVEYLEKAALHAQQHESPNVIDNLQTNFKSLFVDFLVYMVYEMNKGMNIDVLFDPQCTKDTIKLFLDILRVMPVPKLPEITMLRIANDTSALKESKEIIAPPKFPYFAQVSTGIEKLVEQAQRELNQFSVVEGADDLLSVLQCSEQNRAQTMSSLFNTLQTKLTEVSQGDEKSALSVGVSALLSQDSLWCKYLEDFTHQKLLLEFESSGISDKVRTAAFGDLEKRSPAQRLAILHVYVQIHKLNLAKVVSILRPLDHVEDAVLTLTSMAVAKAKNRRQSLLASVEDGSDLLGCSEALSSFIISTLFHAIAGISMTYFAQGERQLEDKEVEQVKLWFKAYRDVMSMPSLREHLYGSRSPTTEAQHSAMHLLYLMVRSKPAGNVDALQCGLLTFSQVFTQYFTTRSELQKVAPRLENLASVVLDCLSKSAGWDMQQARGIMEGLLSHFFSQLRAVYNCKDIEWFLGLANTQRKWQATFIMDGIYEFEYSEDLNNVLGDMDGKEELTLNSLAASLPMSVFKFYLRQIILTSIKSHEDPIHSVMLFFNKAEAHKLITKTLCSSPDLGRAGPYIPTFYQLASYISPCPFSENKLMQQPLAHLYFLTVLEDLKDSQYGLSGLVKTVHNISKSDHWFEGETCNCCDEQSTEGSSPGCQLVLLQIEEQALTQIIIKEVARHLDSSNQSKMNALFAVLSDVNTILDDKWMGGGDIGGHGLTLAMHLLREKKSFHKFLSCLTSDFNTLCDGINCLQPLHQALPTPAAMSVRPEAMSLRMDSSPFMPYKDLGSEFTLMYSKVLGGMNAVHSAHGSSAKSREKEFVRLADECATGEVPVTSPSGAPGMMSKMACFRTTLWLATYNDFFLKKRQSKTLYQVLGSISKKLGESYTRLIQCFLEPDLLSRGEAVLTKSPLLSPLMALFTSDNTAVGDLQRALVHLMTAVLMAPTDNTSLWCLAFNQDHVTGTYFPGFMYDSPVGPNDKFYDNGVDLNRDGFYARLDTIQHLTRGTIGLHALYSLLWTNFGSLFWAQLTQPKFTEQVSGSLFSPGECVTELVSRQMYRMWDLLASGLSISEEERALLMTNSLNRLIELHLTKCPEVLGRLTTTALRDSYEKNWHLRVFTSSWNSLRAQFASTTDFPTMPVIKDIIKLDLRYPWAPGVPSLTDMVLSSDNIEDQAHPMYPLSQYVISFPRLRLAVDLLPSLLELYEWLHTELSYALTYEQATTVTLGRLSKVLTKHSMLTGVNKIKEMFNQYVQMTGCTGHLGPVTLGDDTPLLHLLSFPSEQSTDLVFTVIKDLITFLNNFLESILVVLKSSAIGESLFPTARPRVPVTEFVHHYMLIAQAKSGGDLLQLIHGRTILPIAYPTDEDSEQDPRVRFSFLPGQLGSLIDVLPLQEDILSLCVVGMPLIDPASIHSLRLPFKFKEDSCSLKQLKLQDYAIDLESVASKLPEAFKAPLDDTYRKRLDYEFHNAGYHTVMEVITGLRTAIGHLIKDVSGDKGSSGLVNTRLPEYLVSLYEYDPQNSTTDVFHEIGINSLSQAQHACLDTLCLDNLFNTRNMFVGWAEDGLYDFCSLPFGVKKHMRQNDEDAISQLPGRFEDSPAELLKTLRSLVEVLIHLEPSVVKNALSTPQRGLVRYLEKLKVCNNIDTIRSIIPATVFLENYVALRVAMRRLITRIQAKVSKSELATPEPSEEKWTEFIPKLWEERLPHFRRRGYVVQDPPSSHKRPGEGSDPTESYSSLLNELIRATSERNLLEAFSDEDMNMEGSIRPPPVELPAKPEESLTIPFKQPAISDDELQTLAKNISVQQVVDFLQSVKLDQYATTFEESEINGELLLQFQDSELEEMEIESALDRLKITVFFKRYLMRSGGYSPVVVPPEDVVKIFDEVRHLRPYSKAFLENAVDSELIQQASDQVLCQLGVDKGAHRLMIRNKFSTSV